MFGLRLNRRFGLKKKICCRLQKQGAVSHQLVAVPVAQQVLEGLASSCDHAALFVCSQRTLQLQSIWSGGRERPELEVEHLACGSTEFWWKTLRQGKHFFGAFPFQGTLRLALSVTSQTTVYLLPIHVQGTLIGVLMVAQKNGGLSPKVISDAHRSCRGLEKSFYALEGQP